MGELYYQVQHFRKIKRVHTGPCGRMELPHNQDTRRELYELPSSYHRGAQLYTKILCGWNELSRDRPADWEECEYGVAGDMAELPPHVRHPDLLPAHSAEEIPAAPFLLPPGDVPFTGSDRLHRGKVAGDLVAGADRLYPVRAEDAKLAYNLPVDLREIPGKGKYSKGKSIRKRAKSVYSRQEAGHWEADTVVSGQGKSKACFATLAERKTRFYIAVKMPDRRAETMENAIVAALSAFPPQLVKTITCDRGTEFANWRHIEERLHCEVYFADPYCAWQKGTNENLNGLLREFYPKGRNLSRVAPTTLKRNLALINARPRKVLNFHSAQELWDFELNSCCT